jgi:hypothetical protein
MPIIHPIFFEELSYTCKLKLQLNDSLMRKGYAFKYYIIAVDEGIIPLNQQENPQKDHITL